MAFKASTYDLPSRITYVDTWEQVRQKLQHQPEAYIWLGDKVLAEKERHQFNRVRAALRAQKTDGWRYDFITVTIVSRASSISDPLEYGLCFQDRESTIRNFVVE